MIYGDQTELDPDLWSVAAHRNAKRIVWRGLAFYGLCLVCILPWASVQAMPVPGLVGVFTAVVVLVDLVTAFILLSQTRGGAGLGAALTASAYVFSAIFAMGHVLAFPGAIVAGRPVLGLTQLASYTYVGWRFGFALMMLSATLAGTKPYRSLWRWAPLATAIIGAIGLVALIAFEPRLPLLVDAGRFSALGLSFSWATTIIGLLALLIAIARWRTTSLFYVWIAVALTFFCGDLALGTFAGGQFTLGWYGGRLSGCLSSGTLLVFFLLRFDQQQRVARAAAAAARDQAVALVEEVSRRKQVEAELQGALAERNIFAEVLETTTTLVQVVDLDFRWLAINKAATDEFTRIFGKRPSVGDSMLNILDDQPEQRAAVEAIWTRALSGEAFTETAEFGDPALDRRYYEMSYNRLQGADGQLIGAYQFGSDVTARVLEQRRLADAEEGLRQAQKMETIGHLTGGVAHDFNNLLTPIVSTLDLLRRRIPEDGRSQRMLDGALSSAERAKTLIQRLMAFARRQHLQPQSLDLSLHIESMSDMLTHSVGPGVELRLDLQPRLSPAKTDPNQFELVLLNLTVNARDAMAGKGVLTIQTAQETVPDGEPLAAGDYVSISVSDTGAGMDAETLRRAIEPFFTTKELGRGTGLGLSMAHGFVSQLGGDLKLRSELGKGTVVVMRLPVSTETPTENAVREPALPPEPPPHGALVLLVDDESLVRRATAEMLTSIGYAVTEASSGAEAIELMRSGLAPFALVTDYAMPSMTGAELAKKIRDLRPGLPVLIITGFDGPLSDSANTLPHLTKPFREAELARAVRDAILEASEQ